MPQAVADLAGLKSVMEMAECCECTALLQVTWYVKLQKAVACTATSLGICPRAFCFGQPSVFWSPLSLDSSLAHNVILMWNTHGNEKSPVGKLCLIQ